MRAGRLVKNGKREGVPSADVQSHSNPEAKQVVTKWEERIGMQSREEHSY